MKAGDRVKGLNRGTDRVVHGFLRGQTKWGLFIVDFPRWNGNPGQMPKHQWLLEEIEPDEGDLDE